VIKKWEIRAAPSTDDPDRHFLLLQGGPSDVLIVGPAADTPMGRVRPNSRT
jgi:hypothetical protein